MRFTHSALAVMMLVMMTPPVLAAKRLGPPIEELQSTPDRVRIVAATAGDNSTPGQILFKVSERLFGESPDVIELRTDAESHADVEIGEPYIVAWSYMRRNRAVKGGWEKNPDGPSIVTIMGLGSPALFRQTEELSFLFSPGTIDDPALKAEQLDALLAQMARNDAHARGLAVAELYLREDLAETFSPERAAQLKSLFESSAMTPQHLELLIRAALEVPGELTDPWLAEELRRIIIQHGTQYDLASFVPALVRTAARGLQQTGSAGDIGLLTLLLYSNNPGVAKAATAAMNAIDPDAAAARARQALERGWIHSETRRALTVYLQGGRI
ncbi:MAG: hypothetical protein KJO33_09295 [Gammaproteobacteria bacterium]|nr:hypothetical protein [Gammaproteobacteria bacterium]